MNDSSAARVLRERVEAQRERDAAHTPAELQKRIDALLDEGLTTDEILARLEAYDLHDKERLHGC